jgi:TonB-dependent receptor
VPRFTAYSRPLAVEQSFTDVLPSLNLRYKAAPDLQFRFALARALSRPGLEKMQAYSTLSQSYTAVSSNPPNVTAVTLTGSAQGNPYLKPVKSDQLDLTGEWYFAKNGSLTVAAFAKQLKDIVIDQTATYVVKDNSGQDQSFIVTSPVNGAKGSLRGVELAFQTYLGALHESLSGFGVQLNYTYVDSKSKRYNAVSSGNGFCSAGNGRSNLNLYVNGCDTDGRAFGGNYPLVNLSRNTWNFSLLYDDGPLSARLAYSWRQGYLYGVALNSDNTGPNQTNALDTNPASATYGRNVLPVGLPLWAGDYGQLDAGVHYKISKQLSLGLEAQNLTNEVYKQYMQQNIGMKLHNYFVAGRRYTVSMRFTY